MSNNYRFLAHRVFRDQVENFDRDHSDASKALRKQFEKAAADPFNAGEAMRGVPTADLQGRILKTWVKGRGGFRFLYIALPKPRIVLGLFISSVRRSELDYSKFPWESWADQIYEDLLSENLDAFEEWAFEEK